MQLYYSYRFAQAWRRRCACAGIIVGTPPLKRHGHIGLVKSGSLNLGHEILSHVSIHNASDAKRRLVGLGQLLIVISRAACRTYNDSSHSRKSAHTPVSNDPCVTLTESQMSLSVVQVQAE
jgi:hypothetical protein